MALLKLYLMSSNIMGRELIPLCNECGYKSANVILGGNRSTHLTYCGVPALNTETNEVETINYLEEIKNKIPKYIIYNEHKMFIGNDDIGSHDRNDLQFKIQQNFCPKCKTYNLEFGFGRVFD